MKAINILRMRKRSGLGTLSTNQTSGTSTDTVSYWMRGFAASGSAEAVNESGVVGSVVSNVLGAATVTACFWVSYVGPSSNGGVRVEVSGNRVAGDVNTLSISGVDQGLVGAPAYNATQNTTTFSLGNPKLNPFSGTQAIVIT